jgi:hypothetical protein
VAILYPQTYALVVMHGHRRCLGSAGKEEVTVIQALKRGSGELSMSVSILRLLFLLSLMTHYFACAWWYIGACTMQHSLDLVRLFLS